MQLSLFNKIKTKKIIQIAEIRGANMWQDHVADRNSKNAPIGVESSGTLCTLCLNMLFYRPF